MEAERFLEWLVTEKKMGRKSAKDVLSRIRRVCRLTDMKEIDKNTLAVLNRAEAFSHCTLYIRSQLKRAVTLYLEFSGNTAAGER